MKLNQFAVYRVDQQTAGKSTVASAISRGKTAECVITVENYRLVSIHEMQEEEKSR